MKKSTNRSENFVKETMESTIYVCGDEVRLLGDDERILLTNYPVEQGKVGIAIMGDGGHLPVFLGYVSQGILGGCAMGNVFASPFAKEMADMIKVYDHGSGVLCLYGSYGGNNMDFDMAREMVEMGDVETRTVRVKDDVASSPKETKEKRRGVAGIIYGFKAAGTAAKWMVSPDEVATVVEKALDDIRTMGAALPPCIVPQVGEPTFKIGDDEIEIGMGVHGGKGIGVREMMTTDEVAKTLVDRIAQGIPLTQGDEVPVSVDDLGAIPMEEQLIVYRCVHELLTEKGMKIIIPRIGEYITSMEMVSLSVAIFKLSEQLKELLAASAKAPFYTNLNK